MPLKLTIIRRPDDEPAATAAATVKTFDRCGGILGREPDTDWVLPHRYVSRRHAEVRFEADRYYVRDMSQNGVYVNGRLVGQGNAALLTDGDRLAIGDYEMLVQTELAAAPSSEPVPQPAEGYSPAQGLGPGPLLPPAAPVLGSGTALGSPLDDLGWLGFGAPAPVDTGPTRGDALPTINEPYLAPAAVPEIPENWWEDEAAAPPPPSAALPGASPAVARPPALGTALPPAASAPAPRDGALQAFFAGLGIPPPATTAGEAEVLALAGALLRELVRGTIDLLLARASIKQEARLDLTALRATENNPLKFSASAEEALGRLLSPQPGTGFLEPRAAVREAMQDLRAHEIATLAGLEAAVRGMFDRFDPVRLERDFSERSLLASILPAHRKAKCWDLYEEQFRQIGESAREDFNALFGREFARAYQEQVERLRAAGPR
jgi:type VI secretion system FHA domain protein